MDTTIGLKGGIKLAELDTTRIPVSDLQADKVYDGITKNLSDVTLNTMDDAKSLIDILKWLAIESNMKHNYIVVPQVEIEIKL